MEKVYWNNENLPSLMTLDNVMNSIRNHDIREGLLYEAVTIEDIIADSDGVIVTDGIVTPLSRLQAKIFAMQRVMNSVAKEGLKVVGDAQISDPFMRLGTANIAVIFQLEDGQTISVFFHNPDVNPKTITGSDTLISFKWLLNKKDVSIVVAPERGQEINVRQVAMRIMRLAEKNSVAFQRQNAQSAARKEKLAALKSEIEEKRTALSVKLKEIEELEAFNARSETDKAIDEEEYQKNVAHYETIAQELEEHYGVNDDFWKSSIAEIQSIPTALAERLEIGLEEANFHYERYIFKAKRLGLTKVADILESQQRTGQLLTAFVSRIFDGEDMFNKALQESYNQDAINSLGKPAQKFVADLRAVFGYAEPQYLGAAGVQSKAEDNSIKLTGNELGDFDISTDEGKKALREAAFNRLVKLADNGDTVFCKAVNAEVGFNKAGAKKFKSLGANPIKNQLAAAIKQVIQNAELVRKDIPSYDTDEQKRNITYSVVKTKVTVSGEDYGVRTVLRKLEDGQYQYDVQVKDNFEMIMDSANENGLWAARLTKSDVPQSVSNQDLSLDSDNTTPLFDSVQAENIKLAIAYVNSLDHQVLLDDTSLAKETLESTLAMLQNNLPINVKEGNFEQAKLESEHIQSIKEALITLDSADYDGYVLNLFVYDKDGNLIEDEYIADNGDKDIGRSGNKHILIRDAMSVLKKDVFSNKIANTVLALNVDSGYFEVIKNTRKAVDDFVRSNSNVELFQYPDVNRLSKHIRYIKGEENKEAADILERIGYTVDRRDPDDFTKGFYIGQEFLLKGATGKFMEASFKLIEFRGLNMGAEEPFAVLQMGNTIHSEPVSKLTEKITNRDVLIFSDDDKQEEAQEIQAKFKQQFESLKDEIKLFLEQNKYEYNPVDWTYIKSTHNGEIVAYLTDTNINVDLKVKDTPLNKNVVESHIFRFNEISATKIIDELKRMESRDLSEALATYQEEQNMQQQKIWAAFGLNTKSKETPMTENQEGKEDLSVHSNDELQYEQKLDAKANRKYAITAEMKDQFIQLCRQYGYDDGYLSDVSIGNTVFYIEKEMNDAKVSIEAAFKGSQVERHQDNYYDFTVSGDKANDIQSEWFYTNDFAEALKWGNEWLAKLDSDDKDKSIMKETESSADFQFLQDIIDGKVDVVADSFEDEFEPIVERLGEEHELVKQALEVYAQTIEKFTAGE